MRLNFLIFGMIFSIFANANTNFDLIETLKCDRNRATKTKEQLNAGSELFKILYMNGIERIDSCLGWTNFGEGDNWYIIDKRNVVHGADIKDKKYFGSWSLGVSDPCENSTNPDCVSPWWVGRWGADEVLESQITKRMVNNALNQKFGLPYPLESNSTLGCFANNPLRYGDIEGDGKKELVLMTHDSFIVFSPERKKTIFAFMFDNKDWVSWAWLIEEGLLLEDTPDSPQFGSLKLAAENKGTDIGYRGQAKIFKGNFESETTSDLIVWRKFYQSRLKKDPVKGFEKISDTYIHYKLVDGEYKKQPTEQEVVKGWLADKNLTWQKGYPSKSECPGQEGQLIPEMHDPLLNDPDVLK